MGKVQSDKIEKVTSFSCGGDNTSPWGNPPIVALHPIN